MVPVICIAGGSNSGKTTLIVELVGELKCRGYCVGVVKHTHHDVDLDTPGKDTSKYTVAGAGAAALITKSGLSFFRPDAPGLPLEEIVEEYFTWCDIVVVEGFKDADAPKLEVRAVPGVHTENNIGGVIGIVAAHEVDTELPVYAPDDIAGIAGMIEREYLQKGSRSEVKLWVDGEFIELKPFVKAFVGQTVKGMINSLRGCKKPEKIRLKIGR